MSRTAFVFPGQGSQSVGMGKTHYEGNAAFARRVDQANEILGYDLKGILFDGPDEVLRQTEHTQPAIFLHSVALFETLDARPDMVAGHSLGEYSALVASGAVAFEDALRIVRRRGQLMQEAGTINPGTMAAVIGMADADVERICAEATEATGTIVVPANYNSPGQLVISGHEAAIDEAIERLKAAGCKIAKKLAVSGAFHSPLMQPALDGLRASLEALAITPPRCPVYQNVTATAVSDPEALRTNVLDQLLNPVRWTQSVVAMQADGATTFVEVGPGSVLQGLIKRTVTGVELLGHS